MTETRTAISNLDFALNYARAGLAVFPIYSVKDGACACGNPVCSSPAKHPVGQLVPRGCLDATADEQQIRAWWSAMPSANIGIATGRASGLVVVDLDEDKGADVDELFSDSFFLLDKYKSPVVQTGGGKHFYYRYPETGEIKNSASKLGKFIDVRGDGGYVVAPPSVHISGRRYEFLNERVDFLNELQNTAEILSAMLDFPQVWINKLTMPASALPMHTPNGNGKNGLVNQSAENGLFVPPPSEGLKVPESISWGARNETLTKLAGAMRHHGFSPDSIFYALRAENSRLCKPPLDDAEVNAIARSIGRYAPNFVPQVATDEEKPDFENTLQPFLYADFLEQKFDEKEILGFHIGKRDIAIIQAATNAGKTTLLRNAALCMAAGRPFHPFYDGGKPIKIAYFDFENDAQDVQKDLMLMDDVFTIQEYELLKRNLIIIPKGLMRGELFQFNTHERWANQLIFENAVEFIIVDNVSAAYDLNDENSNAEVTKKIIKPLLKMAYKGNCAFLFAHHYGKGKANEIEAAGVHAGRGASALQALSRTVINMFGDVSKGEPVTVECAKRKTDGGQNYREVFALKEDRWFHQTTIVPPPLRQTAYQAVRNFFDDVCYPATASTADVITTFEDDYGADMIKKALNELYKDGFIERPKHGQYCGKKVVTKAVNFYEKEE